MISAVALSFLLLVNVAMQGTEKKMVLHRSRCLKLGSMRNVTIGVISNHSLGGWNDTYAKVAWRTMKAKPKERLPHDCKLITDLFVFTGKDLGKRMSRKVRKILKRTRKFKEILSQSGVEYGCNCKHWLRIGYYDTVMVTCVYKKNWADFSFV